MNEAFETEHLGPILRRACITVAVVLTALLLLRITGLVTVNQDASIQMVEAAVQSV